MKALYPVLAVFLFLSGVLKAQSDNCATAPTLTIMASCASAVAGTSSGATQSIPGCTGNADDDVWYKFVATGTSHMITVTGSAGYDPVIELFSGVCASLVSVSCMDNTATGQSETINATGLTVGNTYYLRIYNYGAGSGSSTFTTCITNPPPAPANDNCSGAINLTVNNACVNTAATSYGGTQSLAGCSGTADDDVWFAFTANNYTQTIQVTPSASMDPVLELFSGSCGAPTSITCEDIGFTGGNEVISATGLVPGNTYYVRVYDYYSTGGYPFNICVSGAAITGTTQPNDNPCSAIQLPPVTADCNYLNFSTVGATTTPSTLAPTPSSCVGGSGAAIGGYTSTPSPKDVWFKITVPASGNICITAQPNMGGGSITDGVMALYSGTCGSLTQIACSDDNVAYPGAANDALPYINTTGLAPGSTVYLRYWAFGTSAPGNFGICVQSPTNDLCSTALYICDLNGYSASTSAAYTPDHPCNMRGNGEGPGPTYTYSVNANPAGPFGAGGSWGTGSAANDVSIQNNSWIRFTAALTTASLKVTVGNCWVGNYPSGGIQMQIFSAVNCCSFVPVSDFKEGSSTFTVNAVGLTVGSDYYLMVDGYANDICNYTIQALAGVAFPAITAMPDSICPGGTTTLTAPAGATSYNWMPGAQTTRTITVNPGSTITYTCVVDGVCGYRQTLTKTIVVKPLPNVQINGGSPVSTCGTQTITLTGSGASTYTWNTGPTTSTLSVAPASNTTYTLTGKTNGCTNTAVVTVTVNPIPNITASGTNTICYGQSTVLTGNGGTSYTWSPGGAATSITVSPTSNTVYNVTGINAQGCTKTVATTVTVNALPSVTASSSTVCAGKTATLNAGGASTYTWSTGATGSSITASPGSTSNYTVTGTGANTCTNAAVGQVFVAALPAVTATSGTICMNSTYTISAGGANVYNWSTGQSGNSISVTPTVTTSYTVTGTAVNTCTNTNTATVTVLPLPQLVSTPSVSPSNCGTSTGSITSVSVSGAPALSYTWTNASAAQVGNSPNLVNEPAGTYNLHVTDGNGCVNLFGPYSITNPGAPSAPSASAAPSSLCQGGTIGLTANGGAGVTYNWSGPNSFTTTTQNPTLSNASTNMSGVYSVFLTSAGCSGPATSVTITVNTLPNPSATASQTAYCASDTVHLFGSSASTYTWSGPGSFSSHSQNPSISNGGAGAAGTYTLAVTDANGCTNSNTVSIAVNANPAAQASANPSAICAGSTVSLSASGGNSYSWQGPNGFSSAQQSPSIPNAGTSYAGQYTVTVTNASGCATTTVTSVSINTVPSFTAGTNAANTCYGGTIQLSTGGNYTYAWSGPGAYTSSAQDPAISPATTGNSGTYTVTAINGSSCSSSQTVAVNVYPQIIANASAIAHVACAGNAIALSGTGGGTYAWTGPGGFSSGQQNPQIPNAQVNASGIYTFTVTDLNGCSASDTTRIIVNPLPLLVSAMGDSTCHGSQLTLNANFGSGVSVNWYSDPALTTLVQANSASYSPTLTTGGTYTYYAQGTSNGCTSGAVAVTAVYHNVHAVATANVYSGTAPLSVNFTGSGTGFTGAGQFSWVFGDGTGTGQQNPAHVFNNGGTYTVVLTVTDAQSGCLDTASVVIKVDDDLIVIVPNVFTPNNDGANDAFHLTITGAKSAEGYIYNRWGQLLFSWDALNSSWDGKATNGENCPDGTYFYLIKVVDKKDKEHLFPGYALLTR